MNDMEATFATFGAAFGGHYYDDLRTRAEVVKFLDRAAAVAGPSGERSTAEIITPEGDVAIEFALFEDCAYLRRNDEIAVEPGLLNESGALRAEVRSPNPRLVHNLMDEVETLSGTSLLCTPSWVQDAVLGYALTGRLPEDTVWRPAESQ
ncbi:hypothetical protein LO763_18780 [Glycomyces sp. A-F 0318]|uniref:hypothetical protein n=1 Tax=Glycomyces amatae TaxID=2881355 RepID=UPI001E613790|nr:hypothetical protein [Glycomyces amatae]MCD0445655.1 hypothetical protein [Glycomyces amatae]